jgi:hypothetical protein
MTFTGEIAVVLVQTPPLRPDSKIECHVSYGMNK